MAGVCVRVAGGLETNRVPRVPEDMLQLRPDDESGAWVVLHGSCELVEFFDGGAEVVWVVRMAFLEILVEQLARIADDAEVFLFEELV